MKKLLIICATFMLSVALFAQDENITSELNSSSNTTINKLDGNIQFFGKVEEVDFISENPGDDKYLFTKGILTEVNISVRDENGEQANIITHENGKFSVNLEAGNYYTISFKKEGFVSKYVTVDVTDALLADNTNAKHKMRTDMMMFEPVDGKGFNLFTEVPVAKANFNLETDKMEWDESYTSIFYNQMIAYINNPPSRLGME